MIRIISLLLFAVLYLNASIELKSDTSCCRIFTSGDSAFFISPKHLYEITEDSVLIELSVNCAVNTVLIIAYTWPEVIDTIAVLAEPPFKTQWYCGAYPDHDQVAFQLGYILCTSNGDTIISPPQPHHWIINRSPQSSKKRYICHEADSSTIFSIDGLLNEWEPFRAFDIGHGSYARLAWTSSDLFFAIDVFDPSVTVFDRIELSIDLLKKKGSFFDINHRILVFSPKTRSFTWAVKIDSLGAKPNDSLIIRIDEETEWFAYPTKSGYIIEGKIPFCILSNLDFPPKKFGFDITIINGNDSNKAHHIITSWSDALPSARHMPCRWGNVTLVQRYFPLKVILLFGFFLLCGIILLLLIFIATKTRKELLFNKIIEKPISKKLQQSIMYIRENCAQNNLTAKSTALATGLTEDMLNKLLFSELDTTFTFIKNAFRINLSKKLLLSNDDSVKKIARDCGFDKKDIFEKIFLEIAGIDPVRWREIKIKERIEELEDDELI